MENTEWQMRLDKILAAHVGRPSPQDQVVEDAKDKLVGASFVVVDRTGNLIDPESNDKRATVTCQPLFSGSAGHTGLDENAEPWTVHTFAWMASLTKLPSAICLLQLVDRGCFTLDEDLRRYFRDLNLPHLASVQILRGFSSDDHPILEPNARPITLRHLLTHTSGLAYDLPSEDLMKWRRASGKHSNNLTWTEEGFSTPLLFEPGTEWLYGTSMDWATRLLESITGKTLGDYMEENIFRPLGMSNSVFRPGKAPGRGEGRAPDPIDILFRGEDGNLDEMHPQPIPSSGDQELESGGAGLFSTTYEYSKILRGVLDGKLLSNKSIELLFEPQLDDELQKCMMQKVASTPAFAPEYPPDMPANFAFGGMVNLEDIPGKRKAGSVMWSGMSNCRWWIDKAAGIAGVMVVSVLPYGDPEAIKLFDELERGVYEYLRA